MQAAIDNTKKFSGRAAVYREARSGYAAGLFEFLARQWGIGQGSLVADIGSGTGILTAALLDLGATVYAVEPNRDMRLLAEQDLGDRERFVSVDGTAEESGLPAGKFDLVCAASAFHWFDPILFKRECQRILKPDGRVALIWNESQLSADVNRAREEVYKKYCPNFVGFSGGHKNHPEIKEAFFDGKMRELRFANPVIYDKNRFVGRLLSSSYSLTEEDPNFEAYLRELEAIFDRIAVDGQIVMPQETVLYCR